MLLKRNELIKREENVGSSINSKLRINRETWSFIGTDGKNYKKSFEVAPNESLRMLSAGSDKYYDEIKYQFNN